MIKFKKKYSLFMFFIIFIIVFYCFSYISADTFSNVTNIFKQTEAFRGKTGYEFQTKEGIASVVALVIQAFLGLLGIIFVVLIVIAGNKWMNARGNEEKVEEAQETIRRAIIGLIITVSAYAITYFVFSNLPGGGGTGGPI